MKKKLCVTLLLVLFTACGHADWMLKETKVETGQKIGVVRWGHGPKGKYRKADAYREIETYCAPGTYHVVREYGQDGPYRDTQYVAVGGVMGPTRGGGAALYTYIEFICREEV